MKRIVTIASGMLTMAGLGALVVASMMSLPELDPKEHECLALNIYHESRGERVEGQIGVAHVTLNRVNHDAWPNTICEVVYQNKQFSWTHTIKDHTPKEDKSWQKAKVIARDVMIGNTADPTEGATFYHAGYVNPEWNQYMKVSKIIGQHIFYYWDGQWTLKKQKSPSN